MTATLPEYTSRSAQRYPEARAVVLGEATLTYSQLEQSANRLARAIVDAGCARGDRVILLLPKGPPALVAILGVLKAGCVYVPIDLASPASRVAKILRATDPGLILVSRAAERLVVEAVRSADIPPDVAIASVDSDVEIADIRVRFTHSDWNACPADPLPSSTSGDDAAYIMFTSGSTGVPKGVPITHSNVVHFVEWACSYFGLQPSDRISGHPPLHFDLSVFDIFGTFAAGAELHPVPPELNLLPQKLVQFIRSAGLTQWFSVPSTLTYITKHGAVEQDDFPALRRVIWCGEVLPTPVLIHWMQRLPHVQFTNLYGPTEATVASAYFTVPAPPRSETEPIPIGAPCAGEELLVLDERLGHVPRGQTGELFIGGVGLSPGYWRDEEASRAAFLPNPHSGDPRARLYRTGDLASEGEDGLLYFHGRLDSQIKSRGYRIELGEIEAALSALAVVDECAVVAVPSDGFEGTAICCAYSAHTHADVQPASLRARLGTLVPPYMIPSRWLAFETLPKNASGKIDRRKLRELFLGGPQ